MDRRSLFVAGVSLLAAGLTAGSAHAQPSPDPENTLYMDLKGGRVVITMFPDLAPKTVAQIKTLARQGFYDNTPFHRVIEGFMAQGGDPSGSGSGGSKLPNVPAEFTNKRHFLRGTCGMARTSDPSSGNSQFFIMFAPGTSLDGQYTIWGQVVQGMDYVDQIKRGTGPNGMVTGDPDRIVHLRVMADVK
jgi:cyclophilin family peptidyl-prolyl cis-trans isomerase